MKTVVVKLNDFSMSTVRYEGAEYSAGAFQKDGTYVNTGMLSIIKDGKNIAIYAPGSWFSVKNEDR